MGLNKMLITLYLIGSIHHTIVSIYTLFGLNYSGITDAKLLDMKLYNFRYLTTWNFMLQSVYFSIALLSEIMPIIKNKTIPKLITLAKIAKGTLFCSVMFSSTICVFTIFWFFHLINHTYVLPPGYERVLPIWLNHCIHTNILFLVFVELPFGQIYVPKHYISIIISVIYAIIYTMQYMAMHFETGRWLYGIMYHLDYTQQILFVVGVNFYMVFLTVVGILLVRKKTNKFIPTKEDEKMLCVRKFS